MYQRRLLMLAALGLAGLALPVAQMVRLTVVKGETLRVDAEKKLINEQWLETIRGRILDRKGRVLAADQASLDVSVDYTVISGQWAYQRAAAKARKLNREKWAALSPDLREDLIQQYLPEFNQRLDDMWTRFSAIAGVSRPDIEDRKTQIREMVAALAASVTERARQKREDELARGEEQTVDVKTADVRRPIREQSTPHVILKGVPESVGFEFMKLLGQRPDVLDEAEGAIDLMPGVHVAYASKREYPMDIVDLEVDLSHFPSPLRQERKTTVRVDGVATHVLGWMRDKIYEQDLLRRPRRDASGEIDRGHYRIGDSVGQGGFEQAAEDDLRGLRGVLTRHLDVDQSDRVEPAPGGDVRLTIDAALQARVQALFDPGLGLTIVQPWHKVKNQTQPELNAPKELPLTTPLNGAVVIVDVATGDVLSLVSIPSFSHQTLLTDPARVFADQEGTPFLNRAIDKPYPPGSIVKPLMLCSAITARKLGIDERIDCTGHFFPDKPLLYRCWIYKQFHNTHTDQLGEPPDGKEAIQVSCNIFFFELGKRLGPQGVNDWYTRFGLGPQAESWNLFGTMPTLSRLPEETDEAYAKRQKELVASRGLLHEFPGQLTRPNTADVSISEAILMGIGQGPITWTPMHAADAYATIARGGVKVTPRLRADAPQQRTELGISAAAIRKALAGLHGSANEKRGTTFETTMEMPDGTRRTDRIFNVAEDVDKGGGGISIWAKSGTADAPPFKADPRDQGADDTFDGDHAWCVFLAGVGQTPKYAVSVVVEHGGSGGRVAGPVANQVVWALIAEGYLPAPASPAAPQAAADVGETH